jgi:hypothetical protein
MEIEVRTEDQVWLRVWYCTRNQIWDRFWNPIWDDAVGHQASPQVRDQVWRLTWEPVEMQVEHRIGNHVIAQAKEDIDAD